MLIGFVQGYEELKWGISKLNPLCNGPQTRVTIDMSRSLLLTFTSYVITFFVIPSAVSTLSFQ